MMGVDTKQLAAAKEIGKHVEARIVRNSAEGSFSVTFVATDEQGKTYTADLVKKMSSGMATQLSAFFSMKGKISGE